MYIYIKNGTFGTCFGYYKVQEDGAIHLITLSLDDTIPEIIPADRIDKISIVMNRVVSKVSRTSGIYRYKSTEMKVKSSSDQKWDNCYITTRSLEDAQFLWYEFMAGRALPYLRDNWDAKEQPRPLATVQVAWSEFLVALKRWWQTKVSTL